MSNPSNSCLGPVGARLCVSAALPLAVLLAVLAAQALAAEDPPPIAFEGPQVLAKVDSATIVAGDVVLWALAEFNRAKEDTPAKDRVAKYREAVQRQVTSLTKIKLLYLQAVANLPDDELADLTDEFEQRFDDVALAEFLKGTGCSTQKELEEKLKPAGSSIERLKRNFVESQIAENWFRKQVNEDQVDVTYDEALARYEETGAKYDYPARVRFEELVVKISDYRGEDSAQRALVEMRERVKHGEPWAAVAKARSEGTTAAEGGQQDWINEGSHRSRVVDRALFSLRVGEMSPILKDNRGVYLVRVKEREPAGRTPFDEVQAAIIQEIKQERTEQEQIEYMKRLFGAARIWTIFDERSASKRKPPRR
ncbi:MAG TPA: peptidyl-prolyl cis-trans isomerase [Pirellulales bacterium]|jgi:parvulin-like peptidyl-prolyl isomerase|nr:peptidyl-prolyl cis-trans isomerase [Pirellulales bacterium]